MLRKTFLLFAVLILTPSFALTETIDVHIKGVDDGVKTTKQQDYKEAVLFAKREAIERAGVKVKALTTAKDFIVHSDYIETKAEAVLLPGYNIIDVGYTVDGTYQIVLIGKITTAEEGIDSKELRYAKTLIERGEVPKARKIIADIINNSKNDDVVAEAMYCQVLWRLSSNDVDTFERLKAYYPNSKYVNLLEPIMIKREKEFAAKRGREVGQDGSFIAYSTGVVFDKNTGLEWFAGPNRKTKWNEAKAWVERLNVAGGGWRMPTRDELKTLYQKGAGTDNMTPLLKTTGWFVWSGETKGSSSAWALTFNNGNEGWYGRDATYYYVRGFAVRSRR